MWLFILPAFWLIYLKQSMEDAMYTLNEIKNMKKEDL